MDWDSQTNKKHIEEAEARGCRLLGSGRDKNYRLYELPCKHAQEVTINSMRLGNVRCGICMAERLNREAEAHGCKLVGTGKNAQYRLYALPCKHEQEVTTREMRKGGFECGTCREKQYSREAKEKGCEIVGTGNGSGNRIYQLPCKHRQDIRLEKMRKGIFECKTCLTENYEREAKAQDCKLIGAGKKPHYRIYELACGHQQEVHLGRMRIGRFHCSICFNRRLHEEAQAQRCKLLGTVKRDGHRMYELACKHKQVVSIRLMRTGAFECKTCMANKHSKEASAFDCVLLGKGRDNAFRLYKLPCGHKQEIQVTAMRVGNFRCQTCEESHRTLPSNVYLLHIKVDSDEWLKLGYAKLVDSRALRYGLPDGAEVTTVRSLSFPTGNEAHAVEAGIHKRYRRKRLTHKQMRDFHAISGGNECYPVTMLDTLLADLEAVKQAQVG